MNFKLMAAAALLATSALTSAHAATPMTDEAGDTWSFGAYITGPGTAEWTFDPTDGYTYDSIVAAFSFNLSGGTLKITDVTLDGIAFTPVGTQWLYGGTVSDAAHTVAVTYAGTGVAVYSGSVMLQNPTAVPEPESYAMMLAGLGAIGFMARRRQSKQA